MDRSKKQPKLFNATAFTVCLLYFSFGMVWINMSDLLVYTYSEAPSAAEVTQFQTFKGFFFIGITALLLYILSANYLNKLARSAKSMDTLEQELESAYNSTSDGLAKIELDGTIVRTNKNFTMMTGLEATDNISQTINDNEQIISAETLSALQAGAINDPISTTSSFKVLVSATRDTNFDPLYYVVSIS